MREGEIQSQRPPGTAAAVLAFFLAVVGVAVMVLAPLVSEDVNGRSNETSLLDREPGVAVTAAVVVLLVAGVPLVKNRATVAWRYRAASAVTLLLGAAAAILSVGSLLLPSGIVMAVSAYLGMRKGRHDRSGPGRATPT